MNNSYWDAEEREPLSLVTNLADAAQAMRHDRKQAHVETFFSDQKRRGFRVDQSHLADPTRLARLLIALCLAYIWMIYLGTLANRDGWACCCWWWCIVRLSRIGMARVPSSNACRSVSRGCNSSGPTGATQADWSRWCGSPGAGPWRS